MFRPLTSRQRTADIVAAVVFAMLALLATLIPWGAGVGATGLVPPHVALPIALGLTLVFSGALAVRRLSPPLALTIASVAAIAQMASGLPPLPANVAIFGILYTAAAYGSWRLFWVSFASSLVGAAAIAIYLIAPSLWDVARYSGLSGVGTYIFAAAMAFVASALALLLAWTVGALVRTGIRAGENRRAQETAEAETAAEAERTRIARDMHDVVAHSLAVVIAQADGARYAAVADPEAAATALGTISSTARAALSDVRMLLMQLRHAQAEGPQPTLADLEQLYAQVRAAGVALAIDVDPAPRGETPASVQLAVYRTLQEALTNALRHGTGGVVEVTLAWHDDRVELSVTNDAAAVEAGDPIGPRGHGLIGMRERAHLVGGRLDAAPVDGRFVVRAILPIEEAV